MSFVAWHHIASWTGSEYDCSAPLALAFVSPSAREGVEMTKAGYSLPRKHKKRPPPFAINTGLTRRNGLRLVNPDVYDWDTWKYMARLELERRPLFVRQLSFSGIPMPSCFDWWVIREQTKHPVILTLEDCRKETSLPAAVYKELLVALHIWNRHWEGSDEEEEEDADEEEEEDADEEEEEEGCFDARSLSGYPYIQDIVFHGSLSCNLRHAPCLSKLPLQALLLCDTDDHDAEDHEWIWDIASLQALLLPRNDDVVDLSFCHRLPQLVSFAVAGCENFRSLVAEPELARRLRHLRIGRPNSVESFEPLRNMVNLVSLEVSESSFTTLAVLEECSRLERLRLSHCFRLRGLSGLSTAVPFLTSLHLEQTPDMELNLRDVRDCHFLEVLRIDWLTTLVSLSGLAGSPSLRRLVLAYCHYLTNADGLSTCPKLESVTFRRCRSLQSVSGLAGAPRLRKLSLPGCRKLAALDGLSQCPLLEDVDLRYCNGLSSLEGLMGLPRLRRVNLKRTQITDASLLLRTCPSLKPSLMNLDSEELAKEEYVEYVSYSDEDDVY